MKIDQELTKLQPATRGLLFLAHPVYCTRSAKQPIRPLASAPQELRWTNWGFRLLHCPSRVFRSSLISCDQHALTREKGPHKAVTETPLSRRPRPVPRLHFTARAMLCAVYMPWSCVCPSVCLSVCVSVTSRCSTNMAKHRNTQTPHDSPGTLVF